MTFILPYTQVPIAVLARLATIMEVFPLKNLKQKECESVLLRQIWNSK